MEKTSLLSLILWMIAVRVTPMFFSFPEFEAPAGEDSWIALLLSTIPVTMGIWVVLRLWRLDPNRTISEIIQNRAGRLVGGAINLALAGFFLLSAAISLWELDDVLVTTIFTRTPSVAVSGAMAIVVVIAVRQGIEVIARTAIFLVAGGMLTTGLLTFIWLPEMTLVHLLPLFPLDAGALISSTIYHASLVDVLLVFAFLLPFAKVKPENLRIIYVSPWIAHSLIALAMIFCIGVLSFPVVDRENFEYLALVRQASLGTFLERFDPLILTGWTVLAYLRISALFISALVALSTVLRLRDYRALTIPMGIVLLCLSLIVFDTFTAREQYMTGGGMIFNLIFIYVLPVLLWLSFGRKSSPPGARQTMGSSDPSRNGISGSAPASSARKGADA